MLEEIESFFDQLRVPFAWPDDFPSIDPMSGLNYRAHVKMHHQLAMLALDKAEFHLCSIYRSGADSSAAIEFLDRVLSIMRRKASADERMRAIGHLLRQNDPRLH